MTPKIHKSQLRTKSIQEGIRRRLISGGIEYVNYQPGNGTRYAMVIIPIPDSIGCEMGVGGQGNLVVMEANRKGVFLGEGIFLHWRTIHEKLEVGVPDAIVIAELLGYILELRHVTVETFLAEQEEVSDDD